MQLYIIVVRFTKQDKKCIFRHSRVTRAKIVSPSPSICVRRSSQTPLSGCLRGSRLRKSNLLSLARASVVSSIFDRSLFASTCVAPKMDKSDIKKRSTIFTSNSSLNFSCERSCLLCPFFFPVCFARSLKWPFKKPWKTLV